MDTHVREDAVELEHCLIDDYQRQITGTSGDQYSGQNRRTMSRLSLSLAAQNDLYMIHVYQPACRCRSIRPPKLLSPHSTTTPSHAVSATSELVPAATVPAAPSALDPALPFLGRDLPQTTFARLPCTSIPFCADNASAARSAVGRLTKLTKAQSVIASAGVLTLRADRYCTSRDSRLASTMVMFRMSMGLRKGHVKTVEVRTSCSEHCGNPRKSSVVCDDELYVSTAAADYSRTRSTIHSPLSDPLAPSSPWPLLSVEGSSSPRGHSGHSIDPRDSASATRSLLVVRV